MRNFEDLANCGSVQMNLILQDQEQDQIAPPFQYVNKHSSAHQAALEYFIAADTTPS
jgi:hypothetical protein